MSIVKEILSTFLPAKRKQTPSGWISFNAPCCHHNGTSADTRGRGGLISNGDGGLSYHCFNCGFKASWQPGRNLSHKLKDEISSGVSLGTVQLPPSGQPIILLNDSQTTGGYLKLGSIPNFEIPKLSQTKINSTIRFKGIDLSESNNFRKKIDLKLEAMRGVFTGAKQLFIHVRTVREIKEAVLFAKNLRLDVIFSDFQLFTPSNQLHYLTNHHLIYLII